MNYSSKQVMNEFVINKFLKLKLENGKTNILVKNKKFIQCKYLALKNQSHDNEFLNLNRDDITIDDQVNYLDQSLERADEDELKNLIPPETEFWAHCSNIQAWHENDYNTNILHSNLAFPLLKKLVAVGEKKAITVFREEIKRRFKSGNLNVMTYLVKEGYLDQLDIEESDILYEELDLETYKKLKKRLEKSFKEKEGFKI